MVYENATQTCPVAVRGLLITGGGGLIVRVSVPVPVPLLLLAVIVTLYGLAASVPTAGVPEISPVVVFTLKPDGSPLAL
jgi:hypothetical protein